MIEFKYKASKEIFKKMKSSVLFYTLLTQGYY